MKTTTLLYTAFIMYTVYTCHGCEYNREYYEPGGVVNVPPVKLRYTLHSPDGAHSNRPKYVVTIETTQTVTVQVGTYNRGEIMVFGEIVEPGREKKFMLSAYYGSGWTKIYDKDGKFIKFHKFSWNK